MSRFVSTLNGQQYTFDSHAWFSLADKMKASEAVRQQLELAITAEQWIQIRMQVRLDGDVELRHFFGYHSEGVMGYGLKDCTGLRFLTNKEFGNPIGDVLWFIGRAKQSRDFGLLSWFVIQSLEVGADDDFKFAFCGKRNLAGIFKPPVNLTTIAWFQEYFPTTTCSQGFGMDTMPPEIVEEFKALAGTHGRPFEYFVDYPARNRN